MNKTVQNGVVAGVIGIILYLISYFIKPTLMFNILPWLVFITVLIYMRKSAVDQKKLQGGFMKFQEGFKHAWVPAIIAITIVSLFKYVFFTYFDPSLIDLQLSVAMKQTEQMMGMMGQELDGDTYDLMEEQMKSNLVLTFPKLFLGILIAWVMHSIVALIIAAVLKKNRDEV